MNTAILVLLVCVIWGAVGQETNLLCPSYTEWNTADTCVTEPGECTSIIVRTRSDRCTDATSLDFMQCTAPNGTLCTSGNKEGKCVLGFCVVGMPNCTWGTWSAFGSCLPPNGLPASSCFGTRTRVRVPIGSPDLCTIADSIDTESCALTNGTNCATSSIQGYCLNEECSTTVPINRDCVWNDWSDWTPCEYDSSDPDTDSLCTGFSRRSRKVFMEAMGDGAPCSGAIAQKKYCDTNEGQACLINDQVYGLCETGQCLPNCKFGCWGCWSMWSDCEPNCGTQSRARSPRTASCVGDSSQLSPCTYVGCPGYLSVDPDVIINTYPPAITTIGTQPQNSDSTSTGQSQILYIIVPVAVVLVAIVLGVICVKFFGKGILQKVVPGYFI